MLDVKSIESVFATFVRRHQGALQVYLQLLGADRTIAEDLAQEAFLAAFARWEEVSPDGAWLRGAARKLWLERVRREERRREILRCDAAESLWTRLAADREDGLDDYLEALDRCLESLPSRTRELLDRHYRDGESGEDVAAALGMTASAIHVAMHRARKGLHVCVERRIAR